MATRTDRINAAASLATSQWNRDHAVAEGIAITAGVAALSDLSDSQRRVVLSYLAQRYGIRWVSA